MTELKEVFRTANSLMVEEMFDEANELLEIYAIASTATSHAKKMQSARNAISDAAHSIRGYIPDAMISGNHVSVRMVDYSDVTETINHIVDTVSKGNGINVELDAPKSRESGRLEFKVK